MLSISRRKVLLGLGATAIAAGGAGYFALRSKPAEIGFTLGDAELAAAIALLKRHPAIDTHAHPGRTFVRGAMDLTWKLQLYQLLGSFEARVAEDMIAGSMGAACFSGVADFPVLDSTDAGLKSVRAFAPGEAWNYYQTQIANLKALVTQGLVHPVLAPKDIAAARASGKPGCIFAIEGGDFVEDDPRRIVTAFVDGVRMITLVHFVTGCKLGDIMTAPPVSGGITDLGRAVVVEMNKAGIIIDLAHAAETTAFGALAIASKPVIATHTHTNSHGITHPRFISPKLAHAIVDGGGLIGAWPAGIGINTLQGYIVRIAELVKDVGIDSVAIGTDMDANYQPVFDNYRQMPLIVGALLKSGMNENDVAKIIGGNFLRLFAANLA